jgi:uncharacterized membrane protein
MLSKLRLEALSDGLFAIVFTLLVIEIHVPEIHGAVTDALLWQELLHLGPLFVGYFVSFVVLAMFWLSHNFFYAHFVKEINRTLLLLNIVYLSFISLIPFSAHLIGSYPASPLAITVYGVNVLVIGLTNAVILWYARASREIDTAHIPKRLFLQAQFRSLLTPACTVLGILVAHVSIPLALLLYAFPIVFNIVPGSLNTLERLLRFELGK